ncbi:hypothetical protein SAMN05192558_108179 [Actinokineospora alba]|uniref:Uncharacterized protein n=1 Tax=Actinokineospora alba TaxID=504798 RepID=A0A1H0RXV2_9PSEU|nr:hypothetical protein C8E96_2380 [Actinokineospora alba]SDI47951.1 hypothetical protein SAMN05421871_105190 [Actinokineospora alba]SDP34402.1 hypothetical protein SAMN05192558_108179 [Actinokineospora alba]
MPRHRRPLVWAAFHHIAHSGPGRATPYLGGRLAYWDNGPPQAAWRITAGSESPLAKGNLPAPTWFK